MKQPLKTKFLSGEYANCMKLFTKYHKIAVVSMYYPFFIRKSPKIMF